MSKLNIHQIEAYRYVMLDMKRIEREFWFEVMNDGIEAISNAIIGKLAQCLSGKGEGNDIEKQAASMEKTAFFQQLFDHGLDENDIRTLQNANVDLSGLTFGSFEELG